MIKVVTGLVIGLALGLSLPSLARDPCATWGAPQIVPPRVGIPDPLPLSCILIDGVLRCQ